MEKTMASMEGRMREETRSLQVPMEEEINLERQMPDVDHVVGQTVRFYKEQVHVGETKTSVQGSITYRILYAPAGGSAQLCCVTGSIPFVQSLLLEKEPDWEVEVRVEVGSSSVKRLNSRKLSLFVMLTLEGEAFCAKRQEYVTDVEGQVEKRFQTVPYSCLLHHGTTAVSIKECVSLSEKEPNISRILFENVELRGVELIPGAGHMKMRGEVAVFLVYEAEEPEGSVQYYVHSIPVEESCDYPGNGEESLLAMRYQVVTAEAKEAPDEDGQMRDLHVSVEMEISYDVYENKEFTYLADAYSKFEDVSLSYTGQPVQQGMNCQLMRVSVEERFSPDAEERLLMIYPVGARVQMEKPEILEGELLAEGMVVCTLMYIGMASVQPAVVELSIPFHQTIHQERITKENLARSEAAVWGDVAGFYVSILDGTKAEVRASVNLTVVTRENAVCQLITQMESEPYKESCGPGMVGVIVSGEEELWELAKENRTTVETILRINDMSREEIKAGTPILVCQNL